MQTCAVVVVWCYIVLATRNFEIALGVTKKNSILFLSLHLFYLRRNKAYEKFRTMIFGAQSNLVGV